MRALDELAAKLRRPVQSLSALESFDEERIAELNQAIDRLFESRHEALWEALRNAFPAPLRRLLVGAPRQGKP